jgi:hypothetical protein
MFALMLLCSSYIYLQSITMKKLVVLPLVAMVLVAAVSPAFAHSGRTNRAGCHRDSRTGRYHCH